MRNSPKEEPGQIEKIIKKSGKQPKRKKEIWEIIISAHVQLSFVLDIFSQKEDGQREKWNKITCPSHSLFGKKEKEREKWK